MKKKLKNVYLPPETKCNRVELESSICNFSKQPVKEEAETTIEEQDIISIDGNFEWE